MGFNGFSLFQVGFNGFSWFLVCFDVSRLGFHGSRLVLHGSMLASHVFSWFQGGLHGFSPICTLRNCILARLSSLGLAGRDVTFLDQGGQLGPPVSDVTFLDHRRSVGTPRQ